MVADLLHEDEVELLDSRVEPVDYDLPAITTGGRWWVSGHARRRAAGRRSGSSSSRCSRGSGRRSSSTCRRSTARWPSAGVPWKTEAEVYRSDLAGRLPDGLTRPAGARRLRPRRDCRRRSGSRRSRSARRRGTRRGTSARRTSSAGSRPAAPWRRSASCATSSGRCNTYATGRLAVQVVPMLMSDEIWQHPLCAAFDDELRDPAARGRGRLGRPGRRGRRAARPAQPRRRLPQQPAGRRRTTTW